MITRSMCEGVLAYDAAQADFLRCLPALALALFVSGVIVVVAAVWLVRRG